MASERIGQYFLPGEERPHYAAFVGATRVTAWTIDKACALGNTIGTVLRCEWRSWSVSPVEWGRSVDAASFRKWEERRNVSQGGIPLEPRLRRPAY